jgi:hypothetical protein
LAHIELIMPKISVRERFEFWGQGHRHWSRLVPTTATRHGADVDTVDLLNA